MNKIISLLGGAGLAFATIALAHADPAVTGTWKLSVGANDAPCTLTLADAGSVNTSTNCDTGEATINHWKTVGNSIQLYTPNGELVAWLKPKGDSYTGTRFSDGRKVALDR